MSNFISSGAEVHFIGLSAAWLSMRFLFVVGGQNQGRPIRKFSDRGFLSNEQTAKVWDKAIHYSSLPRVFRRNSPPGFSIISPYLYCFERSFPALSPVINDLLVERQGEGKFKLWADLSGNNSFFKRKKIRLKKGKLNWYLAKCLLTLLLWRDERSLRECLHCALSYR